MKKIVYLINNLNSGGAEWNLANLAKKMNQNDKIIVITFNDSNQVASFLKNNKVQVINLQATSFFDIKRFFKLRKILNDMKPDILHSWQFQAIYWGVLLRKKDSFFHISSIRGIGRRFTRLSFIILKILEKRIDSFAVNSQFLKRHLQKFLIKKPIEVIKNSTKIEKLSKKSGKLKRVLYLGRRTKKKGLDTLIKAFLQCQDLDMKLDLVGRATSYEEKLKRLIKRYKLNNVSIKEPITYHKVPKFIQGYDLLILPSLAEGLSNVICQAISCKVLVLASDIPSNQELIKDSETGFLFETNNVSSLVCKLRFIAKNYSSLQPLKENAYLFAQENLAEAKIYKQYHKLYNKKEK